jgi:O-antigen/teichoic acid export membrane protein
LTLYFGGGIIALAIVTFGCTMISRSVTIWFARREVPQAEIAFRHFDKKTVKELFSYSIFAFIISFCEKFRYQIPGFIIGGFLGPVAVAHYGNATELVSHFIMTIGAVLGMLMPVFAQQQANNDYQTIRKTLRFAIKCATTLALFVGFGLIAWGHPFLERWVGKEFCDAYPWLVILVMGWLCSVCQIPATSMLFGLAKHSFSAASLMIEAAANFVLGLILIQYYGCFGVALATAAPLAVLKLIALPFFVCYVVKESVFLYYWNILRTVLICAAALILPSVVSWYLAAPNYPALLLTGAISSILYLPVVFAIFTRTEREYVWNALWKKSSEPQS